MSNVIYFVDTETGGLDPSIHSIFSISIVKWMDEHVSPFYTSPLIKEKEIIYTDKALEINGIDLEEVERHGVDVHQITSDILNILYLADTEDYIIGGHNVAFDVYFIKRLFRLSNRSYPFSYKTIDTVGIARFLNHAGYIDTDNFSLFNLCKYFGIIIEGHHTAYGDAVATAKLYNEMLGILEK